MPSVIRNIFSLDIACAVFLLCIVLGIFTGLSMQGLDVTDTGYHLTNQYELIENLSTNIFYDSRTIILSDLIGGIWLHISPSPSLLWAFLGGSLIFSLTAFFTYCIQCTIFHKFNRLYLFILILFSSLFIGSIYHNGVSKYIHYYSLPALLFAFFFYIWVQLEFKNSNKFSKYLYSLLLGCILTALVLSRVNNILFLCVVLVLIAIICYKGAEKNPHNFQYSFVIGGVGLGFLAFFIFLQMLGINYVEFFLHSLPGGADNTHSVSMLWHSYISDGLKIGILTCCILAILFFISIFLFYRRFVFRIASLLVLLTTLYIIYNFGVFSNNENNSLNLYLYTGLALSIFIVHFFSIRGGSLIDIAQRSFFKTRTKIKILGDMPLNIFPPSQNKKKEMLKAGAEKDQGYEKKISTIFFLTLVAMFIGCFGSGLGFLKISYGLLIPLTISFICIFRFLCSYNYYLKSDREKGQGLSRDKICKITVVILALILFTNFIFLSNNHVQRDDFRLNLTEPFQYHSLKYIYSSPSRVKEFDEFLNEIDTNNVTNQKILLFNSLPIVYYLTGSKPAYPENPWPDLRSEKQINLWQSSIEKEGNLPVIFARAKYSMGTNWPNVLVSTDEYSIMSEKMRDYYTYKLHYTKVWENDIFEVYKKPGL